MAANFVQTKSMRDTAAMLDLLSGRHPGDPFQQWKPSNPYKAFLNGGDEKYRIGFSAEPLMDAAVDPEIKLAVERTASILQDMGHDVFQIKIPFDHEQASTILVDVWLFGFHRWLDQLGMRNERIPGPDTLEEVTWSMYNYSKKMDPYKLLNGLSWIDQNRRALGNLFSDCDLLLTPTTAQVAVKHGVLSQDYAGMDPVEWMVLSDRPIQYSFMYNVMGAPAISLPLFQHSSGLPIGIQLGARPACDHMLIEVGATLEQALPWQRRVPPIHATHLDA